MESRLALPSNTILGGYRVVEVVGSGGFGITYRAEDINLGTLVAIKEYYPFDFGDRYATMSVRPKSERHKNTFEWGRTSFLQEARTLARFRHSSIVRVSRVFEANSTASMVMDFETGENLEVWLTRLGRPPAQDELDRIVAPLLEALELMHAQKFLHRDIAPDNIIVRIDGTPVLLDFGAARRAVAEMSRSLTGIIKAGYSPHEQYAADSRLQGPWSDIYALGATLYRAVTGKPPEEATLRLVDNRLPSAAEAAAGSYRPSFLAAIDACLKVRHADRPQSVEELRQFLRRPGPPPLDDAPHSQELFLPRNTPPPPLAAGSVAPQRARRWPIVAVSAIVLVGGYAVIEQSRNQAEIRRRADEEQQRLAAANARKTVSEREAALRKAEADAAARPKAIRLTQAPCKDFPNLPADHALKKFNSGCSTLKIDALGLTLARDGGTNDAGVVVVEAEGGSAEKGLLPGNVILKVGNTYVTSLDDVSTGIVQATKLGRKAVLLLIKTSKGTRFSAVRLKAD